MKKETETSGAVYSGRKCQGKQSVCLWMFEIPAHWNAPHHLENPSVIDRYLPWLEELPRSCRLKPKHKKDLKWCCRQYNRWTVILRYTMFWGAYSLYPLYAPKLLNTHSSDWHSNFNGFFILTKRIIAKSDLDSTLLLHRLFYKFNGYYLSIQLFN